MSLNGQQKSFYTTATIANGQSLSGEVDLQGNTVCAILIPSAWTNANLTFAVSYDNGVTYYDLEDSNGTEVTVTNGTSVSKAKALDVRLFAAVDKFKIRSGTSGTPVNQGADRVIGIVSANFK